MKIIETIIAIAIAIAFAVVSHNHGVPTLIAVLHAIAFITCVAVFVTLAFKRGYMMGGHTAFKIIESKIQAEKNSHGIDAINAYMSAINRNKED